MIKERFCYGEEKYYLFVPSSPSTSICLHKKDGIWNWEESVSSSKAIEKTKKEIKKKLTELEKMTFSPEQIVDIYDFSIKDNEMHCTVEFSFLEGLIYIAFSEEKIAIQNKMINKPNFGYFHFLLFENKTWSKSFKQEIWKNKTFTLQNIMKNKI